MLGMVPIVEDAPYLDELFPHDQVPIIRVKVPDEVASD